jgi:hypothetical protein
MFASLPFKQEATWGPRLAGPQVPHADHALSTSMTACAKASGLLRQVVPYAAGNVAMLILADVLPGVDARVSMRRVVRIAFQRDRR